MLKICCDSICVTLEMIFKQALLTGVFPSKWKKGNIAPIHKKGDKHKILKIINQFLYFRFVVKYLKDFFLTKCLSFSPIINSSLKPSLVFEPVIAVSTNCYKLPSNFLDNETF